jgi:hypothetical protein
MRNDLVDHVTGCIWEHKHRQSHADGAEELGHGQAGIEAEIGKDAEDGLHGRQDSDAAVRVLCKGKETVQ